MSRDYNLREIAAGRLGPTHLAELVRQFQRRAGLAVDGRAGPDTRAALEAAARAVASFEGAPDDLRVDPPDDLRVDPPDDLRVVDHWLVGASVERAPAHPSWYGHGPRRPLGVLWHYTDTDPGTADAMARRRGRERRSEDRAASWHVTVCADGRVVQMIALDQVAWHCARGHVLDAGTWVSANRATVGVELEGRGLTFPAAQVAAAGRVLRALVRAYEIPRKRAMLEHSALDPERRRDPGPVWMSEHAPAVLAAAYD